MNIIFFGTPSFSLPSLEKIITSGRRLRAVVTVPDKPQGRGRQLKPSPVKELAAAHQIPILQPQSLSEKEFISDLQNFKPDIMVVVAFRILPPEVFTIPSHGTFNLHASLLPKYRGAAPINWAIINGERETGVTTFFLEEKVDTGNIILQAKCAVDENETAGELHDRLSVIGAEIVLHTIQLIEQGKTEVRQQDESIASRAPKLTRELCRIDWKKSAREVHNLVRGLSPSPAAFTRLQNEEIKIYRTEIVDEQSPGSPGKIVRADTELFVEAGKGRLKILELQREGKKRLSAEEFLRGHQIQTDVMFT